MCSVSCTWGLDFGRMSQAKLYFSKNRVQMLLDFERMSQAKLHFSKNRVQTLLDFGRMSQAKRPFSDNEAQNHQNYNVFLKVVCQKVEIPLGFWTSPSKTV